MSDGKKEEAGVSGQVSEPKSGLAGFWAELKRRKVTRVAITYAVVAWLIIQVADTTFEGFGIPIWAFRFVMLCVILGFPVAIILAWAFELTPDGIKVTKIEQEETKETVAHAKKRNLFSLVFAAAVPTLIFGTLAIFFYFRSPAPPDSSPAPLQVEDLDKSIAVLPLENMSPDPDNAFFADGVQEEILTNLDKIKQFFVIGRASTLQYRDTVKPINQIGRELGVRYLLDGSVQRAGEQVRVSVQLIDTLSEGQLWSERYTRDLDDFFEIISSISQQIADELQLVLSPEEIEDIQRPPTENQEAYDLYLKSLDNGGIPSLELLEKAVELDPEFFVAWRQLALDRIIYWRVGKNRNDPLLRDQAYEAFEAARRLQPESGMLISLQGAFAFNEHDDVEAALNFEAKAHQKDPDSVTVEGWRHMQLGRLAEAEPHFINYMRKEPFAGINSIRLINTYAFQGKFDEAYDYIRQGLDFFPEGNRRRLWFLSSQIKLKYLESGDKEAFVSSHLALRRLVEDQLPDWGTLEGGLVRNALVQRSFREALSALEEAEMNGFFSLIDTSQRRTPHGRWRLRTEPKELLTALIHFEMENKEAWLFKAEQAKEYLDQIVSGDPIADPDFWSLLAICYALEGNQEKVESIIPVIRQRTAAENRRFRFQVMCEMHIAICYLILGDHDKALDILEAANQMKGPIFLNRELDLWFIFDRLRGSPRFDSLLRGEVLSSSAVVEDSIPKKSIAVLPLENMSPDPDNAFFADGVQGDVILNLGKITDLLVIGRTSTQQYRDTVKTLRQIGQELQVRYLVEGSVRRAGNQVRIGVQLIDSQTGANVWGDTYDRSLDDIFAIQAEVAKRIAGQLKAVILPEELKNIEARLTNNQKAYDLWLKHRQLTQTSGRSWDMKIELLEEIVSLDSEFAEAWAFLSIEYLFFEMDDPEVLAKSRNALRTAQGLDPETPYIPLAQSFYESMVNKDEERSIELLVSALETDPSFTLARRPLGRKYYNQGRLLEAQQVFEAFNRSDPLDAIVERLLIGVYAERRLWDRARDLATKRFERTGDREMLTEVENQISGN